MSSELKFVLSGVELERARAWLTKHSSDCPRAKFPLYSFQDAGIGTVVMVSCDCGAKYNCTDYESW